MLERHAAAALQNRQQEVPDNVQPRVEHVVLVSTYHFLLGAQPEFILRATRQMLDPRFIRDYPVLRDRYRAIGEAFDEDGVFAEDSVAEYAVCRLVQNRLEDMGIAV